MADIVPQPTDARTVRPETCLTCERVEAVIKPQWRGVPPDVLDSEERHATFTQGRNWIIDQLRDALAAPSDCRQRGHKMRDALVGVLVGEHSVWLGDAYGYHPIEVTDILAAHLADALLASGIVREGGLS